MDGLACARVGLSARAGTVPAGLPAPFSTSLSGWQLRSVQLGFVSLPAQVIVRPSPGCVLSEGGVWEEALGWEVVTVFGLRLGFAPTTTYQLLARASAWDARLLCPDELVLCGPRLDAGPGPEGAAAHLAASRRRLAAREVRLRAERDEGWMHDVAAADGSWATPVFGSDGRLAGWRSGGGMIRFRAAGARADGARAAGQSVPTRGSSSATSAMMTRSA